MRATDVCAPSPRGRLGAWGHVRGERRWQAGPAIGLSTQQALGKPACPPSVTARPRASRRHPCPPDQPPAARRVKAWLRTAGRWRHGSAHGVSFPEAAGKGACGCRQGASRAQAANQARCLSSDCGHPGPVAVVCTSGTGAGAAEAPASSDRNPATRDSCCRPFFNTQVAQIYFFLHY